MNFIIDLILLYHLIIHFIN